ncbi:MAG: ATP synthase subunit C [Oscillospiraceae bacterium]|nr:ATPase [Oscillospiraceae bacterium]MCR5306173.1 ATP synthase subunit C [Oscillospiraceae bacterium]
MEPVFLSLLITVLLALPVYVAITKKKSGKSMRRAMLMNLCVFGAVMLCAVVFPLGGFVSAEAAEETAAAVSGTAAAFKYLSAALAVGVGCIGCGSAVGHAAPAAIGALAEDPKTFGKALVFVAMGEGVGIFGVLIAIMILNS